MEKCLPVEKERHGFNSIEQFAPDSHLKLPPGPSGRINILIRPLAIVWPRGGQLRIELMGQATGTRSWFFDFVREITSRVNGLDAESQFVSIRSDARRRTSFPGPAAPGRRLRWPATRSATDHDYVRKQ